MKKSHIIIYFLLIFIYSCLDDNSDVIQESSENYVLTDKIGSENLFNEILKNNSKITLFEFSSFLNNIGFKEINITETNQSNRSLKFQVNTNKIFVNNSEILLNNLEFTIIENKNSFLISDNENFSVKYFVDSKKFFLTDGNQTISFEDLTDHDIENSENIKKYPIYIGVLENFVRNVVRSENEDIFGKYEGTGIGFHRSRANAEYFCERDYQQILTEHSSWCSSGISISCVWDNHLCMCTAEFYSGSDCDS